MDITFMCFALKIVKRYKRSFAEADELKQIINNLVV